MILELVGILLSYIEAVLALGSRRGLQTMSVLEVLWSEGYFCLILSTLAPMTLC